jgi:predicted 2-oxoglutarate/Fe(II)-dependent dioxygenase YbiX
VIKSHFEPITIANVFTPTECGQIIALGESLQLEDGLSYFPYEDVVQRVDKSVRDAKSALIPHTRQNQWIVDRVKAMVRQANNQFEFEITDRVPPELMFVKYPVNGHFGFHIDNLGAVTYRKLSSSIQLSADSDYVGGDLVVLGGPADDVVQSRERGSGTTFPSFMLHKVKRVTAGTRYCLVAWSFGERRFR